jgi:hypothetical protein
VQSNTGCLKASASPHPRAADWLARAADLHPAADADQRQAHLMTAFQGAVHATFATFGIRPLAASSENFQRDPDG